VSAGFLKIIRLEAPWVKLVFVNPGTTAFSQPLDRSIMRPFKCSLQGAASDMQAASLVSTITEDGEFSFDMSIPHLRPLVPLWVAQAIRDIEGPSFVRAGVGLRFRAQLS
jgi:hypothetical protein